MAPAAIGLGSQIFEFRASRTLGHALDAQGNQITSDPAPDCSPFGAAEVPLANTNPVCCFPLPVCAVLHEEAAPCSHFRIV